MALFSTKNRGILTTYITIGLGIILSDESQEF